MLDLPIDPLLPSILEAVKTHSQVILTATPGAGKTTRLPAELLKITEGKIAVLEPRRMATVGACQRIAEERGWQMGSEVGYQVRFESQASKHTRLIFMTDALLLRRLLDDPELNEFELIVIDEFHERNLNQDLVLGIVKELQELGRNIKLLVMSATLNVARLQRFLPDSHHIDIPGKVFPLEIRHQNQPLLLSTDHRLIDHVSSAIQFASRQTDGDILVFLPGVGEIHRTRQMLEQNNLNHDIFTLHGSLSLSDQKNILKPHHKPRIILSTNIAEASVTVPGVDTVIDSGLAKVMRTHQSSGFSRLDLTRIAKFNADQRAGRAAREKPGVCIRLWSSHEEVTMESEMTPECERVDLSSALLLLAHWGVTDFSKFSWLGSPPGILFKLALTTLKTIGALDNSNRLTALGRKLNSYPLPPRWGALLALSEELGDSELAAKTAALMQDKDILLSKFETHSIDDCDVSYRLMLLEDVERRRSPTGVNLRQAQNVLESSQQLLRWVKKTQLSKNPDSLRQLLLHSQTDRLCRRRKEEGGFSSRAVMVGGRGVKLAKESQVKQSEFFLGLQGLDLPGQPDTTIHIACGLSKPFVLQNLKDKITLHEDIYFDEQKGQFFTRRIRRYRDLDLDEPSLTPIDPKDLGERFVDALVEKWDWLIEKNENLKSWIERWKFFTQVNPEEAVQLSKVKIRQTLENASYGKSKLSEVLTENLVQWLEPTLDKKTLQNFHSQAPEKFTSGTGHKHRIHYSETEPPFVEVRLQEMFGITTTPKLGRGQTPLTFKLLAPNYRPVQVTSDITSFWKTTYFEVRKELRSRYPKHSWPENPLTAPPVAKGTRRR